MVWHSHLPLMNTFLVYFQSIFLSLLYKPFLYNFYHMFESESHSVLSDSFWPHGLYSPLNSSGQNTGVGRHSLLQDILPTQWLKSDLTYCRWILYQLNHQGKPRILEWVAYPFSSWSSRSRNWIGVSCIAGRFFASWAAREAPLPYG